MQELQLTLHPGEVLTQQLSLRPLAAGWLRVLGVSWVVGDGGGGGGGGGGRGGGAQGVAMFDVRGRKRKHAKGDRWELGLRGGQGGAA